MSQSTQSRPYELLEQRVANLSDNEHRMRVFIDVLWDLMHTTGVSWVGFYLVQPNEPDERRLILGPCRDTPACSPIGMHGVCGQAVVAGRTLIIRDVADLGANYVACDPRDKSEIVIPIQDERGAVMAVLDLDSHAVGMFDDSDDRGLRTALIAAGFHPAG